MKFSWILTLSPPLTEIVQNLWIQKQTKKKQKQAIESLITHKAKESIKHSTAYKSKLPNITELYVETTKRYSLAGIDGHSLLELRFVHHSESDLYIVLGYVYTSAFLF